MPGAGEAASPEAAGCARVIVTGISSHTNEDTLRDFFAFCGEIAVLHLYAASGAAGTSAKEAIVQFETEAAASTACLLNNAVIDGVNVRVELYPVPQDRAPSVSAPSAGASASSHKSRAGGSTSSLSSIWSNISSASVAIASNVATKAKEFDSQYKVTEKVKTGASTAWESSKRLATDIDEKYKVQEKAAAAARATKTAAVSAASSVSAQIAKARAKDSVPAAK